MLENTVSLYKVLIYADSKEWWVSVVEYEARVSKKSYIVTMDYGTRRISFDKIGISACESSSSPTLSSRTIFTIQRDDIPSIITTAIESMKSSLLKTQEIISSTLAAAPVGIFDESKLVIKKYTSDRRPIQILDGML